ncbi:hypothetical protein A2U01_0100084, partial [Trifolium medium]|nr:hypothetical protein [Trifolium medium]
MRGSGAGDIMGGSICVGIEESQ